jgi:hypothetical protein
VLTVFIIFLENLVDFFRERSDPALSFSDGKSAYRSGKHPSLDNSREGAESGGEASHPDISTLPGYHLLSPCEIKVSLPTFHPHAPIVECSAMTVSKVENRPAIVTLVHCREGSDCFQQVTFTPYLE